MAIQFLNTVAVDTDVLYVDTTSNRVGIGEPNPDYELHVDGQIYSKSSTFPVYFLQRETSITGDGTFTTTSGIASGFHLRTNSSGTIQDGFGGGVVFSLTDSGTASNTAARIYARRDGGNTTGALQFWGGLDGNTILTTMRANGNVGIGTASPNGLLHISSGTSGDAIVVIESDTDDSDNSDNPHLEFRQDGNTIRGKIGLEGVAGQTFSNSLSNATYLGSVFEQPLQFITGNTGGVQTAKMTIQPNNGDVGIGTTSPAQKLDVNGNLAISGTTFVDSTRRNIYLNSFAGGGANGIFFRDGFTYNASITAEDHSGSAADGICISGYDGVSFSTGSNTKNERMRIDSSGNVGIGTNSPNTLLDVSSANFGTTAPTIRITNTLNVGNWSGVTSDLGRFEFFTDDSSGNAPYTLGYIGIKNDNTTGSPTLPSGAMVFATTTYNASGGAVERMRIGSAGQIGIGGANYGTSGQVLTSSGSGSAPSWQDAGAGSSNWTLSGNDIYNNNSGNVGIGTSSPSMKMHINGDTSAMTQVGISNTSTGGARIYFDASNGDFSGNDYFSIGQENDLNGIIDLAPSADLRILTNGSERMRINSSGNVGIGTTNPGSKLHIQALQTFNGGSGGYLKVTDAIYGGDVRFGMADGVDNDAVLGVWTNNNVKIYTNSAERMRITSSGDVGIGTTSPVGKLNVALDGNSGGNVSAWSSNQVVFTRGGTSTSQGLGFSVHEGSNFNTISSLTPSVTWSDLAFRALNHSFYGNGSILSMYINSSGNVGIGTTSPGYKLEVNGTAKADKFVSLVNASNSGLTRDWRVCRLMIYLVLNMQFMREAMI